MGLQDTASFLMQQKKVAIISHKNPDGDTLGSLLGLAIALEQFGIETVLCNKDAISNKYGFIKGADRIADVAPEDLPQVLVFVDCATPTLAGYDLEEPWMREKIIVNIDHHASNNLYGNLQYVVSDAGANCQNVFHVVKAMGATMTPELATALYAGLSTDTGNFLFDNVSAETFRVAAELVEAGADTASLRLNMYESCSMKRVQLQKFLFAHMYFTENNQCAWSYFNDDILREIQPESTDIDGLVNILKDVDGVEVAILFRETKDHRWKASLRSKSWADVNAIANQFGGGGHVRAAGCTLEGTEEEVASKLTAAVEEYLKAGR